MIQQLMMCNKHAYPCFCFVQHARKGEEKQMEWTLLHIICLTALPQQRWNWSSLFSAHNSFWQLHRHAIHLLWHANCVYQRSRRLVCWLPSVIRRHELGFSQRGYVFMTMHLWAGCWFDLNDKPWKSIRRALKCKMFARFFTITATEQYTTLS